MQTCALDPGTLALYFQKEILHTKVTFDFMKKLVNVWTFSKNNTSRHSIGLDIHVADKFLQWIISSKKNKILLAHYGKIL